MKLLSKFVILLIIASQVYSTHELIEKQLKIFENPLLGQIDTSSRESISNLKKAIAKDRNEDEDEERDESTLETTKLLTQKGHTPEIPLDSHSSIHPVSDSSSLAHKSTVHSPSQPIDNNKPSTLNPVVGNDETKRVEKKIESLDKDIKGLTDEHHSTFKQGEKGPDSNNQGYIKLVKEDKTKIKYKIPNLSSDKFILFELENKDKLSETVKKYLESGLNNEYKLNINKIKTYYEVTNDEEDIKSDYSTIRLKLNDIGIKLFLYVKNNDLDMFISLLNKTGKAKNAVKYHFEEINKLTNEKFNESNYYEQCKKSSKTAKKNFQNFSLIKDEESKNINLLNLARNIKNYFKPSHKHILDKIVKKFNVYLNNGCKKEHLDELSKEIQTNFKLPKSKLRRMRRRYI